MSARRNAPLIAQDKGEGGKNNGSGRSALAEGDRSHSHRLLPLTSLPKASMTAAEVTIEGKHRSKAQCGKIGVLDADVARNRTTPYLLVIDLIIEAQCHRLVFVDIDRM